MSPDPRAGFSYVASVPLARDLFSPNYVVTLSARAERTFSDLLSLYSTWRNQNSAKHAEEFLGELYDSYTKTGTPMWRAAVEYIGVVIASAGTPPASFNRNSRYSNRINRPATVESHRSFWANVTGSFENVAVVTTNYDILIEQALRHRPFKRPKSPGCLYGGLPQPQILRGAAQPFSKWAPETLITMTGSVPVFKLHGSLSWSVNNEGITTYQDLRPAFRNGGDAAIVPPVPDKELPSWLEPIWGGAKTALEQAPVWIVCGYSVPTYDLSVRELIRTSGIHGGRTVVVSSPDAADICLRLRHLLPSSELKAIDSLPSGIEQLSRAIASSV